MAAAAGAAGAAGPFVHPISDRDVSKVHRPKHDGQDSTWQAFVYEVDVYSDDIDANYVLARDDAQRANLIAALGHGQQRVQIDQNRIYSLLKYATATYAAPEIEQIARGAADCGSKLWNLLCLRARAQDPTARVSRKEDLFRYVESNFKHDTFDAYFDHISVQRNVINAMGAGAGLVDDEQLVSAILSGVSKDSRYQAAVEAIALLPAPPTLPQLKDGLKRRWRNIEKDVAEKKAHEGAHAFEERGKCPYPGCNSTKHPLSSCPIRAADLKLHREADAIRRGRKSDRKSSAGARDEFCSYKPCGKKGHTEERCFMKKRDEKAKAEAKAEKKKKKVTIQAAHVDESSEALGSREDTDLVCMTLGDPADDDLEDMIMVDTGTSCHITNNRDHLINIRPCHKILGGVGPETLVVTEVGDMPIRVKREAPDGTLSYPLVVLTETYLVNKATKPLISVRRAKSHGFKAAFDGDGPEGFVDSQGNIFPFVIGNMGLSYLSVRYEKQGDSDLSMLVDKRDDGGEPAPAEGVVSASSKTSSTASAASSSSDDELPELVNSESEDDDDPRPSPQPVTAKLPSHKKVTAAANDAYYQQIAMKHHIRCGHTNIDYLRTVASTVDGLEELQQLPPKFKMKPCTTCMVTKSRHQTTPKKSERSKVVHHLVHADTTGRMRVRSARGHYYSTVFVDDASDYKHVKNHALKSSFPKIYKERNVEAGRTPSILRTDGAGEMTSKEFEDELLNAGTFHQKSVPHSQYQNGRAEAAIRTVSTRARALMTGAALPAKYWCYAMEYAAFLENTTKPYLQGSCLTPYEKFFGKAPAASFLRPFGCFAVAHLGKDRVLDGKLSQRGQSGVFLGVGFSDGYKAYRILNVSTGEVFYSTPSKTVFEEGYFPWKLKGADPRWTSLKFPDSPDEEEPAKEESTRQDFTPYVLRSSTRSASDQGKQQQSVVAPQPSRAPSLVDPPSRLSTPVPDGEPRERSGTPFSIRTESVTSMSQLPHTFAAADNTSTSDDNDPTAWARDVQLADYFEDDMSAHAAFIEEPIEDDTPQTLTEAKSSPYWPRWQLALEEERASLEKRNVWTPVDRLPPGAKLLRAKLVYKQKKDKLGNVNRFKCRATAKGFSQVELVHYYDTFAAVASGSFVRTVLSLATGYGHKIKGIDVVTAFLYPELKEELYMEVPEDIAKFDGETVRLLRSIYGTKQAAHNWWKELTSALKDFGLVPAVDEETIFVKNDQKSNEKMFVVTYVDDIIVTYSNEGLFNRFVRHLKRRFDITLEGDFDWYLGVRYTRTDDSMTATQVAYIEQLARTFGGDKWHPVRTPMEEGFAVKSSDCDPNPPPELVTQYRKLLGSLLHVACWTRPDISLAVNKLARYSTCATPKLLSSLKRILRYLIATKELGITWTKNSVTLEGTGHKLGELYAYVDAAFADDVITRRSTMGYVIMLNAAAVSWRSKREPIVALSTAEAEYVGACYAAQEILALRSLLKRLGYAQSLPTCIYEDNQACILLAGEPVFRERSKHIDLRWHFIRDKVRTQDVHLVPCSTQNMVADVLTKALGWVKHVKFIEIMMNFQHQHRVERAVRWAMGRIAGAA
jgi:hypothetical protein